MLRESAEMLDQLERKISHSEHELPPVDVARQ
jgi:hypothetical protein